MAQQSARNHPAVPLRAPEPPGAESGTRVAVKISVHDTVLDVAAWGLRSLLCSDRVVHRGLTWGRENVSHE